MSFSERSYASQSTRPSSAAASRGHNGLANAHSSFAGRSAEADGAAHTATLSSMHESTNTAGAATDSVAHSSAAAADGGEKQQPSEALQRAIAERDAEISRLRALLGAATNASDAVGGALFASRGPHHQQEDGAQGHSLTTATEESPQFIAKAMRVRPCGNAGVAGPDAELTAPDATNGHAAAFYNGRMFVFGGVSSPADASGACTSVKAGTKANGPTPHSAVVSGALWAFSPATSQWARLSGLGGDAPAPRAGHSATIVKGSLLVFGGERPPPPAGARVQHTPFYPTTPNKKASKKAAQPAPPSTPPSKGSSSRPATAAAPATPRGGKGKAKGHEEGQHPQQMERLATVYALDLSASSPLWRMVPPSSDGARPPAVAYHAACEAKGRLYVFGGIEDTNGSDAGDERKGKGHSKRDTNEGGGCGVACNTVRCFDPSTGLWEDEAALNWQAYAAQRGRTCEEQQAPPNAAAGDPSDSDDADDGAAANGGGADAGLPPPLSRHAACYSPSEDAFYIYAPISSGASNGGVYRYCRARSEWSAVHTSGPRPSTASPSAAPSAALVGRLLIVVSGNSVAVLDVAARRWHPVAFSAHSRVPPSGGGRTCVVVDGAVRGGVGAAASSATLLLFGGTRTKRRTNEVVGDNNADSAKEEYAAPQRHVPSRDVWRVDITAGGEGGMSLLEARQSEAERAAAENASTPRRPLGPPRCASAAASSPRARQQHQHDTSSSRSPSAGAGNRSNRRGSAAPLLHGLHPRPFASQTSRRISCQYFSSYSPTDAIGAQFGVGSGTPPPSPLRRPAASARPRTAAEIQRIVERVSSTADAEMKRRELEQRYLFRPNNGGSNSGRRRLTAEEEEASVNRLFYEEVEARGERMAALDKHYYPPLPEPDMTEDDVYESAERLYSARRLPPVAVGPYAALQRNGADTDTADDADATSAAGSPPRATEPLPPHQKAMVDRLYYAQLERSREHRRRLEERYLWRGGEGASVRASPQRAAAQ